jgi:hypothetical protein
MTDVETYLAQYLAPLTRRPRARGKLAAPPDIDARYFYLPDGQAEVRDVSLLQLYTGGVECGHTGARAELKRRVSGVDEQLDELRAVRDRAQGDHEELATQVVSAQRELLVAQMRVGQVETAAAAMQARIDELESSTTWRATAPIRRVGHRAKVAAARLRAQWAALGQLQHYFSLSITVLRD